MRVMRLGSVALAALLIAACSQGDVAPEDSVITQIPARSVQEFAAGDAMDVTAGAEIGTPMQERVATLGLLNKRNNSSQDIQIAPGETQTFGDIRITLSACERTAPWEMQRETGAFVQVAVQPRGSDNFERIFSGWLFKESPSLNVVEHPVYDVWVKDCAMSFPGEE